MNLQDTEARVIAFLGAHPGATAIDIDAAIPHDRLSDAMYHLFSTGRIVRADDGCYWVVD